MKRCFCYLLTLVLGSLAVGGLVFALLRTDVLTLTATPIPRTLHMSLIGIRDMSVLEEAPNDRLPIQTFVCEYNDELVREAIVREMARGGQVY